ncbi:MAG: hypothetical protein LBL92_03430, partial [Propionibacteriaceae bacterium]|nr:hypothetical protein [Propionibacteriaceae bacterium]
MEKAISFTPDISVRSLEKKLTEEIRLSLRLASLVASKVILLDNQVFDGPSMLSLGPPATIAAAGSACDATNIIIRVRSANESDPRHLVEQALLEMWMPSNPEPEWTGFRSSALRARAKIARIKPPAPVRWDSQPETIND